MNESSEAGRFAEVARAVEPAGRLLRSWPLRGGVSAEVTALEIARPDGQVRTVIVRRHGEADRRQNPQIAADEFRLLSLLRSAGVAAPRPYHLDQSCAILPTPYLVIEYIDGAPPADSSDPGDCASQLAGQLAAIHALDGAAPELDFLPRHEERMAAKLRDRPAVLDESLAEGRIRQALEAAWPSPGPLAGAAPRLLHGDFWPGNTLWRDGRLRAVIDWEDAAVGDPLADLGNSRLEILWAFGMEAMHRFTSEYQALTAINCANLPYWDLCAALRPAGKLSAWAADAAAEQRMRERHQWFVAQAFRTLAAHPRR